MTMSSTNKKVLFIDLVKNKCDLKTFPDLNQYIGGVSLGIKLYTNYQDSDPIILSVGPLNGFFPYASKTCVVLKNNSDIEDMYLGGYLSTRIKFSDVDAIILVGKSKEKVTLNITNSEVEFLKGDTDPKTLGLPGKKSFLELVEKDVLVDQYFTTKENYLAKKLESKNVTGITITGTKTYKPAMFDKYLEIYKTIHSKLDQLKVERGFFPSCSGCPLGCEESKVGEMGGNILVHSLVACEFAEDIYSDIGTIFSCLNVLGYHYTHEDIENLSILVKESLNNYA